MSYDKIFSCGLKHILSSVGGVRARLTPLDYMASRDAVGLLEFSSYSEKSSRRETLIFHAPSIWIHLTLTEHGIGGLCITLGK